MITSVDRDDLADGGARHFHDVILAIRRRAPLCTIEVLTPDFKKRNQALDTVLDAQPEIGSTASVVDYVKLIHRGFNENDPSFLSIPKSRRMVSQLLFFGGGEEL